MELLWEGLPYSSCFCCNDLIPVAQKDHCITTVHLSFDNKNCNKILFCFLYIKLCFIYIKRQQTAEATESQLLVKLERERQHQVLQSLVAEVAQLESTRTISGNYQLKCKRQEYFLEKQKIVSCHLEFNIFN